MRSLKVGVLALQGAFAKHVEMLRSLGACAVEVRKPSELIDCDALIVPGGESTTMVRQIRFIQIEDALREFAKSRPIFGTCAGLILMSSEVIADEMKTYGFLDIQVERNAFGRQNDSFKTFVNVMLDKSKVKRFPSVFIRSPRIRKCGTGVEILAVYQEEPVLVRQGIHLGSTFHPELTDDPVIHSYFLDMVSKNRK